jgi:DNA polymerase III gamma/tau subunit
VVSTFGLVRSELYLDLNEAIIAREPARALHLVDKLATTGQSLDAFARGIVTNFRNLMLLKVDRELAPMVDLPPDMVERLAAQADHFSEQDLLALIDRSGVHFERIHRSTQPRILLEASVVEYCRFESRVLLSELARRLDAIGGGPAFDAGNKGGPQTRAANRAAGGRASSGGHQARAAAAPTAKPAYVGSPGARQDPAQPTLASTAPDLAAADQAVPGWTRLIDQLMKQYPRLGSCLMNGLPELNDAGELAVCFAEDKSFAVKSIAAECGTIADVAAKLWGRQITVELVLGQRGQAEAVTEEIRQEVAPTHREELDKACAADAALGDLVDMMGGGKPLPESKRERWDKPGK